MDIVMVFATIGVICAGVFSVFCIICGIAQINKWIEKLKK